jgi:hypothetical protein
MGLGRTGSCLSRAVWRAPPHSTPTLVAGVTSHSGEIYLNSIAVGYGVATLVATGLLFVMQIVEDLRDV